MMIHEQSARVQELARHLSHPHGILSPGVWERCGVSHVHMILGRWVLHKSAILTGGAIAAMVPSGYVVDGMIWDAAAIAALANQYRGEVPVEMNLRRAIWTARTQCSFAPSQGECLCLDHGATDERAALTLFQRVLPPLIPVR